MLIAVEAGFMTGDLRALRAYLDAGYPLDAPLRRQLIEAIDGGAGGGLFTLMLKQNGPGANRDLLTKRRKSRQDWEIAQYVEARIPRYKKSPVKQAIDDAAKKFRLHRTAITEARKKFKRAKNPTKD
jgi:hypothetical protein